MALLNHALRHATDGKNFMTIFALILVITVVWVMEFEGRICKMKIIKSLFNHVLIGLGYLF